MLYKSFFTLALTFGCLLGTMAMVGAVSNPHGQPVATIVRVEGATTTEYSQDWNGQTVTVQEPSHASADIKGQDAYNSVRGIVTAIDTPIHHVKVKTSEGQTIVLDMAPASLMHMQVGDSFMFALPTPRP
jgi:hypothetical protein